MIEYHAMALRNRCGIWYTKGNNDRALADCDASLRSDPQSSIGFHRRGLIWYAKDDNDRAIADYRATPELAPPSPITGEAAYSLYLEHTLPHLEKSGGKLLFYGAGGPFLIGPSEERWDAAMLVGQQSTAAFIAFASNREYLAGMGHRVAALEDSRLLPLVEGASA